jgi:hypothetical protein
LPAHPKLVLDARVEQPSQAPRRLEHEAYQSRPAARLVHAGPPLTAPLAARRARWALVSGAIPHGIIIDAIQNSCERNNCVLQLLGETTRENGMKMTTLACKIFGHKVFDDEVLRARPWAVGEFASLGSDAFAHDDCLRCGVRQAWATAEASNAQAHAAQEDGERRATVVKLGFGAYLRSCEKVGGASA